MTTGRDVVRQLDRARRMIRLSPVLAVRMANAGCDCVDLEAAFQAHAAGQPTSHSTFLDGDGTARRRAATRSKRKAVRAARRRNRG